MEKIFIVLSLTLLISIASAVLIDNAEPLASSFKRNTGNYNHERIESMKRFLDANEIVKFKYDLGFNNDGNMEIYPKEQLSPNQVLFEYKPDILIEDGFEHDSFIDEEYLKSKESQFFRAENEMIKDKFKNMDIMRLASAIYYYAGLADKTKLKDYFKALDTDLTSPIYNFNINEIEIFKHVSEDIHKNLKEKRYELRFNNTVFNQNMLFQLYSGYLNFILGRDMKDDFDTNTRIEFIWIYFLCTKSARYINGKLTFLPGIELLSEKYERLTPSPNSEIFDRSYDGTIRYFLPSGATASPGAPIQKHFEHPAWWYFMMKGKVSSLHPEHCTTVRLWSNYMDNYFMGTASVKIFTLLNFYDYSICYQKGKSQSIVLALAHVINLNQHQAQECHSRVLSSAMPREYQLDKYIYADYIINGCKVDKYDHDLRELGDRMINLKEGGILSAYQKVSLALEKKKNEGGEYSTLESIFNYLQTEKENLEELRETLNSIPWESEYGNKKKEEEKKIEEQKANMKRRKPRLVEEKDDEEGVELTEETNSQPETEEIEEEMEVVEVDEDGKEKKPEDLIRQEDEAKLGKIKEHIEQIEL